MSADWFAARLKELREEAGITQEQLAAKAGLSKDGISHLEQGRRIPSWETVLQLATALGVDCRAFSEAPTNADRTPTPRGRPARVKDEEQAAKTPARRTKKRRS